MIRIQGLTKSLGGRNVLDGFDLELDTGELGVLIGRSGSGKSVCLRQLVGLMQPDSGSFEILNYRSKDITGDRWNELRRRCALVVQSPALFDSMSIWDNLCLAMPDLDFRERALKVEKVLGQVRLWDLFLTCQHQSPHDLSFGEQKRLSLARSLLTDPEILLLDEPTTAMDSETSIAIHDLVLDLVKTWKKSVLMVSHDFAQAARVADKIFVLDEGRIVESGNAQALRNSQHPLVRRFWEASA